MTTCKAHCFPSFPAAFGNSVGAGRPKVSPPAVLRCCSSHGAENGIPEAWARGSLSVSSCGGAGRSDWAAPGPRRAPCRRVSQRLCQNEKNGRRGENICKRTLLMVRAVVCQEQGWENSDLRAGRCDFSFLPSSQGPQEAGRSLRTRSFLLFPRCPGP